MNVPVRLAIAIAAVGTLALVFKAQQPAPLSQAPLRAQTGSTPQAVSLSTTQVVEGVTLETGTQYYFRCPASSPQVPILSESVQDTSDLYVWGYRFSGNEMINSFFDSQPQEIWDGQYFVSQAYINDDPSNSSYDQIETLTGGRWHSIVTSSSVSLSCAQGVYSPRG